MVYESKGTDARRTSNGHIGLIATGLCAEGIDRVRTCLPGEEPGVAMTRYANLAYGYDRSVFVAPLRAHFMATRDTRLIPALSSGGTLEAMQIEYWREHMRPYLPPLSEEKYRELKNELERFEMGRTVRKMVNMEFLIGVLGPHKKKYPTEPIALIDPVTKEMIPDGRWREAIGVAHMRTSLMLTLPASAGEEERLIPFIQRVNKQPFQALTDNCSDFVERGLLQVFEDKGLRFRPRMADVADAWVTSPLEVATGFLRYAKDDSVPVTVTPVPMLAGTRRPTAANTSIGRGAMVPNPSQGKLAFGIRVYFNVLNPLFMVTAYSVDKLERYADLPRLAHERGGGTLSQLAYQASIKKPSEEDRKAWRREQVRVFGTQSCWNAKRVEFAALTDQAKEAGLLTPGERALVLKMGRPFALPRLYERTAAAQQHAGMLMSGMQNLALAPAGMVSNILPPDSRERDALVPGRAKIVELANSGEPNEQLLAFKLMTSVINYDLSSEAVHRRNAEAFDPDWQLLLDVARRNGLKLQNEPGMREPLEKCACREFDAGKAKRDALGEAQGYGHWLARQGRDAAFSPSR